MKNGEIISNVRLQGDYFVVKFYAPQISCSARAGQFVHVRIDQGRDRILRRPFSIHDTAQDGTVTVVYKVVGHGTRLLSTLGTGAVCDLLGPLGVGFRDVPEEVVPVLVGGGYGAAATYLLTKQLPQRGVFLLGARSAGDVLLTDAYQAANYDVRVATNDGSMGRQGLVTDLLEDVFGDYAKRRLFFYGCGPHPMLMALARILRKRGAAGELSIDHLMCCGVGACFACVVKVKSDTPEGWSYARACTDGPVFDLDDVYVE